MVNSRKICEILIDIGWIIGRSWIIDIWTAFGICWVIGKGYVIGIWTAFGTISILKAYGTIGTL